MSWLAIRLFFSGALQRVLKGLSAAGKWLLSDWRHPPLVIACLMWWVHAFLIAPGLRGDLAETRADLNAERAAHIATVENYTAASKQARRDAEANAARVKAEQEKITDATLADLRSDHAALRLRFDRLRARDAARADPRRADAAGLSGTGQAPGRAAAAPADQNLRAAGDLTPQPLCPSQFVCLTIEEAEQASIDAHNHDRLIDWVLGQSAVRFAPEPAE